MQSFDVIVLGLGGMGSAALYEAARRGMSVLGIEQFGLAHDRGSSHGATRIIRRAYFEHPNYVPLVDRSYELWENLERESGRKLLTRCGLLLFGPPEGPIISGVKRAAQAYPMTIEELSRHDVTRRFAGFHPNPDMVALLESDAGFLYVEDCVRTYVERARSLGAVARFETRVLDWDVSASGVLVATTERKFTAKRLIVCAGPWSGKFLSDLHLPLEVRRKVVLWLRPAGHDYDLDKDCPIFGFDTPEGLFYGFPRIDARGVKVGDHTGGDAVATADDVARTLNPGDAERIMRFTRQFMPGLSADILEHSICLYTMTPDEHFIVDRHPRFANIAYAAGFSGHGFKFAPIVGKTLVDLIDGSVNAAPIRFSDAVKPASPHTK